MTIADTLKITEHYDLILRRIFMKKIEPPIMFVHLFFIVFTESLKMAPDYQCGVKTWLREAGFLGCGEVALLLCSLVI